MAFGTIETLATILIAISVIKIITILIKPIAWFNFSKGLYAKTKVAKFISLIIAAVILYFLIGAGITIVQIFAVMLFMAFIMMMQMADDVPELLKLYKKRYASGLFRKRWLTLLVWIVLLVWVISVLFF